MNYPSYLERDWLIWECEECGMGLDSDGCCSWCNGEAEEDE
jgi:hypothetical protein